MDEVFQEVVRACIEDKRLLDIVKSISKMTDEERSIFERKLSFYFMNRSSEEDVQSYRFFKYIMENDNAARVLMEVKKHERGQG